MAGRIAGGRQVALGAGHLAPARHARARARAARAPGVRHPGAEQGLRARARLRRQPRALPRRRRRGLRIPRRPGARARQAQPAGRGAHGARLRPLEALRPGAPGARRRPARAHPRRRGPVARRGRDRDESIGVTTLTVAIFATVYLGMIIGGLPFLQLDRAGVALLGAIALVGLEIITPEQAARTVHLPTLLLLFSFMVISAQMRLGGFYTWVTQRIAALPLSPPALLGAAMLAVAALSTVFSNDVVCLATAPVLIQACLRRRLDPVPFLIALACAANVGSAATLIGNPQNMLIGQKLGLSFRGYFLEAIVPVALGLAAAWALVVRAARGRWHADPAPDAIESLPTLARFDPWQTAKGLAVAAALMAVFLFTDWPRDVAALVGAGVLLTSRRLHSSKMLGLVDWPLLILFIGLFVVNGALEQAGLARHAIGALEAAGV